MAALLRRAIRYRCTKGVKILLCIGVHTETRDNDGRIPLWIASANGQTNVVRALVSAGVDVNTQCNNGSSTLGIASQK